MLCNGRVFFKNLEIFPKVLTPIRQCNASAQPDLGVTIPKRIERGPTDILKALAATVQPDPTAFHYKYPDDPFFYPFSNHNKRTYALALESGRKSARWIVENNPGFFKNVLSDPPVEDFLQKVVYDENSEVTEETLEDVIKKRQVKNAMTVYHLLQKRGIVISDDLKQNLLELVCFFNEDEKPNIIELELKWYANEDAKIEMNTWKEQGFAQTLFESMEPTCPLANSAIIQGMIKYNNVNKAIEIYKRAKDNNIPLSVGVYNALLTQASNTNADISDRFSFIDDTLKEMSEKGVKPNVGTLNAILKSLHNLWLRQKQDYAEKLLAEFTYLGVQPSLGTYYYMFCIISEYKGRKEKNAHLYSDYLSVIESTEFDVMHPSDFLFFPNTAKIFFGAADADLMHRLHALLFQNDNMKFLNSSAAEYAYFREFFTFLFKKEPLEIAMSNFRELVPRVYGPEFGVYMTAVNAIIENRSFQYLVDMWNTLKGCRMTKYEKLLTQILSVAREVREEPVLKVINEAALNAMEYLETNEMTVPSEDLVSNLLIALFCTGDGDKALEFYENAKNKCILLPLNRAALAEIMRYAVTKKKVDIIKDCLSCAETEMYPEVIEMGEAALPFLSDSDKTWVAFLLEKLQNAKNSNEAKSSGNNEEKQDGIFTSVTPHRTDGEVP